MSGSPPTNQAEDDEGGGQAFAEEAEEEGAGQVEEAEEATIRRPTLQAGGVTASSEQEGEESKPNEEGAGTADSEPIPSERDGEEGNRTPNPHPV